MKSTSLELDRLRSADELSEDSDKVHSVFTVTCPSNGGSVFNKANEIWEVLLTPRISWPEDEEWTQHLPAWLRSGVQRWSDSDLYSNDRNTQAGQIFDTERWTFNDWIYEFNPDNRSWVWLKSQLVDEDRIELHLEDDCFVLDYSAIVLLYLACGAKRVIL